MVSNETLSELFRSTEPIDPDRVGRVLVAIPAYNEERCIGSIVLQARLMGFSVLVIDDGSTDRTAEIASAAGAIVHRHEVNGGKAAAMNAAFRYARAEAINALIVLDGDGQHNVSEVEPFITGLSSGTVDIVIGSRFLATSDGRIPSARRFGQKLMTLLTNVGSGVAVTDSQSGFRAFSRRAIEAIFFQSGGFNVEVEMQFLARQHDLKLIEVPITAIYADRPKRNVLGHGLHVLNGVLQLVGRYRPLLFFGVPGIVLLLLGLMLGALVVYTYQTSRALALGYAQITVLLTIIGLLGIFTGVLLHAIRGSFLELERRLASMELASSRKWTRDRPAA